MAHSPRGPSGRPPPPTAAGGGRAQDLRDLTGSQRDHLARGAVLVTSRPVEGYPWGVRLGSPDSTAHRLQEIAQALAHHVERLRAAEPETLHGLVRPAGHAGRALRGAARRTLDAAEPS